MHWLRRRALWIVGAALVACGIGGVAFAYWQTASTGGSPAAVLADVLPQGATPTATTTDPSTVAIDFARATTISARDVTSYTINRYSSPGATMPVATFTCTWPSATTLSCVDSGLLSGMWYYTDTPKIAGTLWIGAESPMSGGVLTDSTAPSLVVSGISPTANGHGYNNTSPVTVSLSASDNIGGSGIASITYWIDAGAAMTVNTSTAAVSVSGDGIHDVQYKATDNAGNSSDVQVLSVKIDTVAPVAPVISTVTNPINAANQTSVSVSGTSEANAIVTVTVADGVHTAITATTTAIGTAWTASGIDVSALNDGTISFTSMSTDLAGNTSPNSAPVTTPKTTTAPTATSINRVTTSPTNTASVQWTVTFSTAVTGVDTGDFSLSSTGITGAAINGSITGNSVTYVVSATTGSGDGTLGLSLVDNDTIVDVAGNKLGGTGIGNGNLAGQAYSVDKTAPTVAVNQKASQADPTNLLPIAFTVVFSEPVTGLTPAGLIRTGTASGGTPTVAGSGATYEISVPNGLTNGTLKFAIGAGAAQDLAGNGNTASTSADNTVTYDTAAPAAPSTPDLTNASDSGSSNTDNITNVSTPTFAGTAEAGATVTLFDGATSVGSGVAVGGSYSITTNVLAAGAHTISAKATDAANNVSVASGGLPITIDSPTVGSVTLINGGTLGRADAGDSVAIQYSQAMDPTKFCSIWPGTGTSWSLTANGTVTVKITNLGANDQLTVSSTQCAFNLGSVALGGNYVGADTLFSGNGSNAASITLTNSGLLTINLKGATGSATGVPVGTPIYTPALDLTDTAGNAVPVTPFTASTPSRF